MAKEVLQITLTKRRLSKNKLVRWFQNLWFQIWCIYRPKIMSKFYGGIYHLMLKMMSEETRKKYMEEDEEIEVHIINKLNE